MSTSPIWLVAKRELRARLFAKASIISTVIFTVLIVGGVQAVAYFTGESAASVTTVGVSEETEPLGPFLQQQAAESGGELEIRTLAEADADAELIDDEIDMYIAGSPTAPVFTFDGDPDGELVSLGGDAAADYVLFDAIESAGGDLSQVQSDLASISVDVVDINPVTSARDLDGVKIVTAFVSISLLFFALIQSSSFVIMGVIEEKASRVVEILLATIRPGQLLAGKVLGIGIMALIQVVLFAAAGALSAMAAGLFSAGDINVGISVLSLLGWFFLGFAIYVSLFGGLASLVSRQEDAGAVTTPLVFGMMVPFYLGIYLIPNAPDSLATKVLSQVPFFSPFMMPVRMGFDAVSAWEIVLAVALCLVTIPLMIWIGGRVYSRAVLNTGGRMKLTEALRG
ncbi:MAG TPA: ABC transporter permease [Beutenbergiaceae bacterium]|nr:ABC transporter permease [Beutenbergiaceae bacterium]